MRGGSRRGRARAHRLLHGGALMLLARPLCSLLLRCALLGRLLLGLLPLVGLGATSLFGGTLLRCVLLRCLLPHHVLAGVLLLRHACPVGPLLRSPLLRHAFQPALLRGLLFALGTLRLLPDMLLCRSLLQLVLETGSFSLLTRPTVPQSLFRLSDPLGAAFALIR
jgi:hypothetical protein